jgi:aspartate racemase
MKTIGLLGGMSWESSSEYYRIVNEEVKQRLGGHHSAQCLMYSVDFAEIKALQHADRWDEAAQNLSAAAKNLERGGADLLVLCTNTMHKVAEAIQAKIDIPLLHIADPTAQAIQARGLTTVGLLGTGFTMEQDFYKGRLVNTYGLRVLVPDKPDRDMIHRVIYDELCLGIIQPTSRAQYLEAIARLVEAGAEGIILGCTEIELLIKPTDTTIPLFDTTRLHATAAVTIALEEHDVPMNF